MAYKPEHPAYTDTPYDLLVAQTLLREHNVRRGRALQQDVTAPLIDNS